MADILALSICSRPPKILKEFRMKISHTAKHKHATMKAGRFFALVFKSAFTGQPELYRLFQFIVSRRPDSPNVRITGGI
jgi:hypothetical protein